MTNKGQATHICDQLHSVKRDKNNKSWCQRGKILQLAWDKDICHWDKM